jgi:hypothetical protein
VPRIPGPVGLHTDAERPDKGTLAVTRHYAPGPTCSSTTQPVSRSHRIARRHGTAKLASCRRGDTGPLVRKVQRLLNERAQSGLRVDGVFGPVTQEAVSKYQRAAGLAADGVAGHRTLAALQSAGSTGRVSTPAANMARAASGRSAAGFAVTAGTQGDDVHSWPATKILFEVFKRTGNRLPLEMESLWKQFATWKNAETAVAIFAIGVAVQGVPVAGEIFDVAMVGLLLATAGPAAFEGGRELGGFLMAITGAATEKDIDIAAEHLAHAVTLLGVAAVLTWLQQRSVRGSGRGSVAEESPQASVKAPAASKPRLRAETSDAAEPKSAVVSEMDQARAANWKRPDGRTWWPPNNGAAGPTTKVVLEEGTPVDRFGGESGSYLSPKGTPLEQRALPSVPTSAANNYVVAKPLAVEKAEIAPWFDQPGGGIQYKLVPPDGWDPNVDGPFDVSAAKRLGYLTDSP